MFDFTEKDSCGVGFISSRKLPATHGMTLKVLECLANLDHRGAKKLLEIEKKWSEIFSVFGGVTTFEGTPNLKLENIKALD